MIAFFTCATATFSNNPPPFKYSGKNFLRTKTDNYYVWGIFITAGLWLLALHTLMIVPVWDEIPLFLKKTEFSGLKPYLHFLWFESKPYRPLAGTILAIEQWKLSIESGTAILRAFNALMVITAFWLMVNTAKHHTALHLSRGTTTSSGIQFDRKTLLWYWLTLFLSPSALIVSAWFANIYDASCLLLIAIGLSAWARGRWLIAGSLLGLAWFCKEAAIFVLPLLVYLYYFDPYSKKTTLKAGLIYTALGILYWFLRSQLIEFASTDDIHSMNLVNFLPTLKSVLARFSSPGVSILPGAISILITLAVTFLAASVEFLYFSIALAILAAITYLGSVTFEPISINAPLISTTMFESRLFYVPLGLFMFGLLLQGRTKPFILLALAYTTTIPFEYQRYLKFQSAYQSYYQLAANNPKGIVIFAKLKDGVQPLTGAFGVKIGEYEKSDYIMNPVDGSLIPFH